MTQPDTKQLLTLIVEDVDDMAQMISDVLDSMHISNHRAADGPSALKVLERYTPDLLILDIGLPGMNGWEVLKKIEDHHPDVNFPVIVLTAYTDPTNRVIGRLHAHVYHFMNKPFKPSFLAQVIRSALHLDEEASQGES